MNTITVKELWRFPVKSFAGEQLKEAEFLATGLLGDRAFALIEKETNKVVTAKSIKKFPDLLDCRAEFTAAPRVGEAPPPVLISLPNGIQTRSDSPDVDRVLSSYFGQDVRLAGAAPEDYTVDQYHPDIEALVPDGHRDVTVDLKLGSALFAEMGMESAVPVGSLVDAFPLSVMTTSTLDRIQALCPESIIDVSRFRMNVILNTRDPGFLENDWVGRSFSIGDTVNVQITMPDPRCVMVILPQKNLPRDTSILKSLVQHNRQDIGAGKYPCAGVYAVINSVGSVRVGDLLSEQ